MWDQTFISFTVRKLQRMGGGDQIRLHISYYVKWAYQKFMVVIMIFRRILHRKTDIPTEGDPVTNTRPFTNARNIHCSVIVKVS